MHWTQGYNITFRIEDIDHITWHCFITAGRDIAMILADDEQGKLYLLTDLNTYI